MARPLRVEFPGAIYHAMSRSNGRQTVFREERDYGHFLDGREATVDKFEEVYGAWRGGHGGRQPAMAYRRFVAAGTSDPPSYPLSQAVDGWLLGGRDFVERIKRLVHAPQHGDAVPAARRKVQRLKQQLQQSSRYTSARRENTKNGS